MKPLTLRNWLQTFPLVVLWAAIMTLPLHTLLFAWQMSYGLPFCAALCAGVWLHQRYWQADTWNEAWTEQLSAMALLPVAWCPQLIVMLFDACVPNPEGARIFRELCRGLVFAVAGSLFLEIGVYRFTWALLRSLRISCRGSRDPVTSPACLPSIDHL